MTEDMCMYCENPAELTLIDSATKRTGSGGNNVKLGSGHPMPVCRPCGDRLAARYGLKEALGARSAALREVAAGVWSSDCKAAPGGVEAPTEGLITRRHASS